MNEERKNGAKNPDKNMKQKPDAKKKPTQSAAEKAADIELREKAEQEFGIPVDILCIPDTETPEKDKPKKGGSAKSPKGDAEKKEPESDVIKEMQELKDSIESIDKSVEEHLRKIRREKQMEEDVNAKMEKYLSPKQYIEWKNSRTRPWAKVVEKIPFGKYRTPNVSLSEIKREFDREIKGREAEKVEILHKMASFIVNGRFRRPLLFVGPPGEGKSCFAKAIAASFGYSIKYLNMPSLNSPIALCGSERHYENSRIGELMQSVIDEETLSMVFVFDEIDKTVTNSSDGSIEAVLLALFDPVWNGMFTDRSLDVPVDLSRCVFICTANDLSSISAPLIDRMDVIRFEPYTPEQSLRIIKEKTINSVISDSGMNGKVKFAPDVAEAIMEYVGDGSMRDYEKVVEKLVDHAIYIMLMENRKRYTVSVDDIEKIWPREKAKALGFGA